MLLIYTETEGEGRRKGEKREEMISKRGREGDREKRSNLHTFKFGTSFTVPLTYPANPMVGIP